MPDTHVDHALAPLLLFEFENNQHTGCGGEVGYMDEGIRATCVKCSQIETWEQAARRLRRILNEVYDHHLEETHA